MLSDTPEMQALLYRQGLLGVRQDGLAVIRDDMKADVALVHHLTRVRVLNPDILACGVGSSCQPQNYFTVELDGIPIATTSTYSLGSTETFDSCGVNLNVALYASSTSGYFDLAASSLINGPACAASPVYGPTYTVAKPVACAETIARDLQVLATDLVGAVLNTLQSKYGAGIVAVVRSASGFLRGVVSLEGFCDVLISALSAAALGELLVDFAIGVIVGMILAYLACLVFPSGQ